MYVLCIFAYEAIDGSEARLYIFVSTKPYAIGRKLWSIVFALRPFNFNV